jgi:two-component system, chemotaxis family, protein-glutamate methylesterase/glutaminase
VIREQPDREQRYRVVVVGASLGGTEALRILLRGMHSTLPVPVVVVIHQGPAASRLDMVLGRASQSPVLWAEDGAEAAPGRVYLGRGRSIVRLEPDGTLTVQPSPDTSAGAVDELFSSAAVSYGPGVLAVVLTGAGRDGAAGCRSVRRAGGTVITQDEAASAAFGMPSAGVGGAVQLRR